MFKLDNFGVILFVLFSYKKLLQCSYYENLKNRFFRKKFKKVCVLQRKLAPGSISENFNLDQLNVFNEAKKF